MEYLAARRFPGPRFLGFAVAILALGLLPGCGDGDDHHDDFHHDDFDHVENLPPIVDILSVNIDRETRQIVVEVAVIDDGEGGSDVVDLAFTIFAGGRSRIVDVLDSTSGRDRLGNRLIGVAFDDHSPGFITRIWLSTITPNPLYSDATSILEVEVSDDDWIADDAQSFDLRLPTEPICILLSPSTGETTGGVVPVRIEIGDLEGDPADLTLWYSFDGGANLLPATLASASDGTLGAVVTCDTSKPSGDGVLDIPTAVGGGLVSVTLHWNSVADGVGIGAPEVVDLFAFVQDCFDRPALSAPPGEQHNVVISNP